MSARRLVFPILIRRKKTQRSSLTPPTLPGQRGEALCPASPRNTSSWGKSFAQKSIRRKMSDGLLPSKRPAGTIRIDRELPKEAHDWGRVVDLRALDAGDLLLFRPVEPAPDSISNLIMKPQIQGRFHKRHAQATHAALSSVHDQNVCEP